MKFKLKGKNIVKYDFEAEYEPVNYTDTLKDVEKKIVEAEAQNKVYVAKMDNVARNHPYVLEVDEEKRNAIWLYHENFVASKQIEAIIKSLKKSVKDINKEMKEITEQTGLTF